MLNSLNWDAPAQHRRGKGPIRKKGCPSPTTRGEGCMPNPELYLQAGVYGPAQGTT